MHMISVSFLGFKSIMSCQSAIAYFLTGLSLRFKTGTIISNTALVFSRAEQNRRPGHFEKLRESSRAL